MLLLFELLCRLGAEEGPAAGAAGDAGAAAEAVEHVFEDPEVGCVRAETLELSVANAVITYCCVQPVMSLKTLRWAVWGFCKVGTTCLALQRHSFIELGCFAQPVLCWKTPTCGVCRFLAPQGSCCLTMSQLA
jgi:hypothetical protein